ncbi:S8 family serine peptidase [Mesonia aquimarina]|uniref:S8 family serine peptidase n=1 Tax=Mesonia aquimarina TaxID=1504967 RepID=UPI0013CF2FA8|nr:S8 family serine peptidase [Mesonia aquimarina]
MKIALLVFSICLSFFSYGQIEHEHVTNEILVKFKNDHPNENKISSYFEKPELNRLHNIIKVSNYEVIRNSESNTTVLIQYQNNQISLQKVIAMYKNTEVFEYVEPNYIATAGGKKMTTIPNDAEYSRQWGLKNDGTFADAPAISGADIQMEQAWDIEKGDDDMIVAIIDSGLRLSHPEFSGRIWTNTDEVLDGTDTDGNGFVDDIFAGWDFINNDNDPTDDHGHGTNVAGIALSSGDNFYGYAGVNWNSQVMICKALNANNSGSYAAMAGAIYYAVDNGAKVINMSIGGSGSSSVLNDAIDYCYNNGVVLVACMMNFNNNISYYPAAYDKTIAVGSTDPDDTRSNPFFWSPTSGSNYGDHIDIVAPGNYIYGLSYDSDTNYNTYWGGTSQASPLVAGVVSLLLAQNPSLTFEEIRTILQESSEDQIGDPTEDSNGFDIYYGYGRLNAKNALTHQMLNSGDLKNPNSSVIISPNPIESYKILNITNLKNSTYTISIYNTLGQRFYSVKKVNQKKVLSLELPKLNSGTYFIEIINESNHTSTNKKLIVN